MFFAIAQLSGAFGSHWSLTIFRSGVDREGIDPAAP